MGYSVERRGERGLTGRRGPSTAQSNVLHSLPQAAGEQPPKWHHCDIAIVMPPGSQPAQRALQGSPSCTTLPAHPNHASQSKASSTTRTDAHSTWMHIDVPQSGADLGRASTPRALLSQQQTHPPLGCVESPRSFYVTPSAGYPSTSFFSCSIHPTPWKQMLPQLQCQQAEPLPRSSAPPQQAAGLTQSLLHPAMGTWGKGSPVAGQQETQLQVHPCQGSG